MTINAEAFLLDTWIDHNIRYFEGLLIPPTEFAYTPTDTPKKLKGQCSYVGEGLSALAFNPALLEQLDSPVMQRVLSDVLLHEMIHQWLYQQGYLTHGHEGKRWKAECKRIASLLNIKLDTTHKRYYEEFPQLSTHISYYTQGKPRTNGHTVFCGIEDFVRFPANMPKEIVVNYHRQLAGNAHQQTRKIYPYLDEFDCLLVTMSYAS